MNGLPDQEVTIVVEGQLDELVARRLLAGAGLVDGPVHGHKGKTYIDQKMNAWAAAARVSPWFVLRDLDLDDGPCAGPVVGRLLGGARVQGLCVRLAVRSVEAWLLADADALARFLSVPPARMPAHPETLRHPKRTLAELGALSSDRQVRADLQPAADSGRLTGPGYGTRLGRFVLDAWSPHRAAARSPSLAKALLRLKEWRELIEQGWPVGGP